MDGFENLSYCLDQDFGKKIDHGLNLFDKRRLIFVIEIVILLGEEKKEKKIIEIVCKKE